MNDPLAILLIDNAKLRARVAALERVLAPLMALDADHQPRFDSNACWNNCAQCQLARAKDAFNGLGGAGGGQ